MSAGQGVRCSCCAHARGAPLSRRGFIRFTTAVAGGLALPSFGAAAGIAEGRPPRPRRPLRVQPVLTYDTPKRREATSWRNWGGIQTDGDAAKEQARIGTELERLRAGADFPLEFLPLVAARSGDEARKAIGEASFDTLLLYAAGGWGLEKLVSPERFNLMFLRHDPGPAYLWYEIVHPRFLRKTVDEYGQPGMDVHDIVVDRPEELLWRLRAHYALTRTLGKRVVCIGGAGGWGEGGRKAPAIARDLWKLELADVPYKDLEGRIKSAMQDPARRTRAVAAAERYLDARGVKLETKRACVDNAFVLCDVFRDLMDEADTDAITVQHCMGTIMGMSQTTACLPLSLLNDEGRLAFCESDFVVIPSGILLHYLAGTPVFLNDPTFPHDGVVTLAHCTAPRRMDGRRDERARILTHFESDYGAAPKVEMRIGQICTNLVPDFACKEWVGFAGTIVGNPFLDICRSQVDVRIHGDGEALLEHMKGFHWMMAYGDRLREAGYALRKLGVNFRNVSAPLVAG